MSMPVSFLPAAPVSPAGPNAASSKSEPDGGARFDAVLGGLTPRPADAAQPRRHSDARDARDAKDPKATRNTKDTKDPKAARNPKERDESRDAPGGVAAGSAVGSAPPIAAGPVGPVPPNADAGKPAPTAIEPATARIPGAAGPGASGPVSTLDEAVAASTVDFDVTPSTVDAPVAAAPGDTRAGAGDTGAEAGTGRQPDGTAAIAAQTARVDAPASTAPASQPAPAPQAPPLPPAAQIALKLAPLRVGPDGAHQMTIHLNPDELGPISVVATVKGGELSVRLTGTTAGADAVKAALPQLEQQLRDGGFNTVAVDVRAAPRIAATDRPAWAGGPGAASATDNATFGTGTTTSGAKTESQPIGQAHQPDGIGTRHPARHDPLATGMYNAAGQQVTATGQAATGNQTGQHGQHNPGQNQAGNQLNFGQPGGNQPDPGGRYGTADQDNHGGRHGTAHNEGGAERLPGRPDGGEREQRTAEPRPTTDRAATRSVDLRV